jgi:hypothetical protein
VSDKVDFKKTLDSYRARRGEFRILEVPAMRYLMIDGTGDPNDSPDFAAAIETLYPVAYKLKFASSRGLARDYVVPPLEGRWWAEDLTVFTDALDKTRWNWTLMIMIPDWLPDDMIDSVIETVGAKKPPPRLDDLRTAILDEGLCVQTPAPRFLRRRGARPGTDAPRVHPRQRPEHERTPPRDLFQRLSQDRTGETPHGPAAARREDSAIGVSDLTQAHQRLLQSREVVGTQVIAPLLFDGLDLPRRDLTQLDATVAESHQPGPAVRRVGDADEVSRGFELVNDATGGLLGDARLLGEVGQPHRLGREPLHHATLREGDVVGPDGGEPCHDPPFDGPVGHEHQDA